MAYFPNSDAGDAYEHNVCSRCAHYVENPEDGMCPVWEIHLFYNYGQEEGSTVESILDTLIPRRGIYNDLCSMYLPSKPEYATHGEDYKAWIESKEGSRP